MLGGWQHITSAPPVTYGVQVQREVGQDSRGGQNYFLRETHLAVPDVLVPTSARRKSRAQRKRSRSRPHRASASAYACMLRAVQAAGPPDALVTPPPARRRPPVRPAIRAAIPLVLGA